MRFVTIEFRDGLIDAGDGAVLIQAMRDEMAKMYERALDGPTMPKAGPAEMNPPNGQFIIGYSDGVAVCCGGIKRLDAETCEIKRMYVVPEARGRGVARELLAALEVCGRAHGYTLARLDSGPKQPAAQHLYESAGYAQIANFNGNPIATFFGEKLL